MSQNPHPLTDTSCNQRARQLCKLICASSFVELRNNSCANHNRLHAPTRVCVCARKECVTIVDRGKRWRREKELGKGRIRRWGRGSSKGEGPESHSETFRLKQCQHIPIIPAHSLSPPLLTLSLFQPRSLPILSLRSFTSRSVAVLLGSRCGCDSGGHATIP